MIVVCVCVCGNSSTMVTAVLDLAILILLCYTASPEVLCGRFNNTNCSACISEGVSGLANLVMLYL